MRVILAWYLDFLFFSVFGTLVAYSLDWATGRAWATQLIGFSIVRAIAGQFVETPGMMLLGIDADRTRNTAAFQNENWLTMLLGTLFILDGTKTVVGWTEYARALPEFDVIPSPTGQIIFSLLWGTSFMATGALLLQLRRSGLWLAFLTSAAVIISVILSWPLWDQAIAQEVIARRLAQGISVRPGEIAFMQRFVPLSLVLTGAALLGLLIATHRRFQN
jgi:hypothetical protein